MNEATGHGVDTTRVRMDGERRCEVCGAANDTIRRCRVNDYTDKYCNTLVTSVEADRCAEHQHGQHRTQIVRVIEFPETGERQPRRFVTTADLSAQVAEHNARLTADFRLLGWGSVWHVRLNEEGARSWNNLRDRAKGVGGVNDWRPGDVAAQLSFGWYDSEQDVHDAWEHSRRMVLTPPCTTGDEPGDFCDDEFWSHDLGVVLSTTAIDLGTVTDEQLAEMGVVDAYVAY